MKYIKDITSFEIDDCTAISLGKFDGIHKGHEFLMEKVLKQKEKGLKAAAFTFSLPTRIINDPSMDTFVITTNSEKALVFERIGIDYLIECPLVDEIMHMEPEAFIAKLVSELNMKYVVVGDDFHFGYKRSGDYHTLIEFSKKYDYEVEVVEKVQDNGIDISSTRVRQALKEGKLEEANRLLGYPYFIEGIVSHGNAIGRKMDLPTVNIPIPDNKQLPPFGVYATETVIDGKSYYGATNVGIKPTIPGENQVAAETNLFDFCDDIYDKRIYTNFHKFIRGEKKFDSLESLKTQIEMDVKTCREYFKI